jgi:hypothetical protein
MERSGMAKGAAVFARKRRKKSRGLAAELARPQQDDPAQQAFSDKDVPARSTFHIREVHDRGEGPYYIAPDSAKPLPTGIWAGLDPKAVEAEAERINELNGGRGFEAGTVTPPVRRVLEREGALGRQVIRLLESGSTESANPPD